MSIPTEREKMVAGQSYDPADPCLVADRLHARDLCREFNGLRPGETAKATALIGKLVCAPNSVTIYSPFRCDYGYNIHICHNTFLNFDCVILDTAPVRIGSGVLLGPGVHVYSATHPMSAAERRRGLESGSPVSIEDDVWIGGRAVICPGVSVGAGSVIGAGSVVTRSIPAGVFAAGNPCRVIRTIQSAPEEE